MERSTALSLLFIAAGGPLMAQDGAEAFEPQTLTVEERIAEGPNLVVLDQAWAGPSKINVIGADDFSMKGNIGSGSTAQMALSEDGRTLYSASVYFERYSYGTVTAVLQVYDVPTLTLTREIEISNKLAQAESQPALLSLIEDGAYVLAQNATPATSVSVVDVEAGEQIAEIPTPGCWGIVPAAEGLGFSTLCGDGTIKTITFAGDGTFSEPASSEQIFDPDLDALFTNGVRTPDGVVFASFKGNLYVVDDSGPAPSLARRIEVGSTQLGAWAPGGSEVIAYSAAADTVFLLMHANAREGSHKDAAQEIWAVDMERGAVVGRVAANAETGIVADASDPPILYTAGEGGGVFRYGTLPGEEMAISEDGFSENLGGFLTVMAVTP